MLDNLLLNYLSHLSFGIFTPADIAAGKGRFIHISTIPRTYNNVFSGFANLISAFTYVALKYKCFFYPNVYDYYFSSSSSAFQFSFSSFKSFEHLLRDMRQLKRDCNCPSDQSLTFLFFPTSEEHSLLIQ